MEAIRTSRASLLHLRVLMPSCSAPSVISPCPVPSRLAAVVKRAANAARALHKDGGGGYGGGGRGRLPARSRWRAEAGPGGKPPCCGRSGCSGCCCRGWRRWNRSAWAWPSASLRLSPATCPTPASTATTWSAAPAPGNASTPPVRRGLGRGGHDTGPPWAPRPCPGARPVTGH